MRFAILISFVLSLNVFAEEKLVPPPILDVKAMNKSIDPCNDFYQFSCGGWIQSTELPAEKSALYRQWSTLDDVTDQTLALLLRDFAAGTSKVNIRYAQELGDAYAACLNSTTESSLNAIAKRIGKIAAIKDVTSLARVTGELQNDGIDVLFGFYPMADINDAEHVTAYFDQGGMGLPEQGYYFPTDRAGRKVLKAYRRHISMMFQAIGLTQKEARHASYSVLAFETTLAKNALSIEDRRDPQVTNNPMTLDEIKKVIPEFDFQTFLATVGLGDRKNFIVSEPKFLKAMAVLSSDPEFAVNLKRYLMYRTVSAVATSA